MSDICEYLIRFAFPEAVHYGKPMVGIPNFFDQHMNMNLVQQKGFGVSVPIENLNTDTLAKAVNTVLGVPR